MTHRPIPPCAGLAIAAVMMSAACAPADPACELEATSESVEVGVEHMVEVEVAEGLRDMAGDGVYAGPQLKPLDHGGVIWESPEIVADTFIALPVYLDVPTSDASATLIDSQTLQLVVLDGAVLTLRPADCD